MMISMACVEENIWRYQASVKQKCFSFFFLFASGDQLMEAPGIPITVVVEGKLRVLFLVHDGRGT